MTPTPGTILRCGAPRPHSSHTGLATGVQGLPPPQRSGRASHLPPRVSSGPSAHLPAPDIAGSDRPCHSQRLQTCPCISLIHVHERLFICLATIRVFSLENCLLVPVACLSLWDAHPDSRLLGAGDMSLRQLYAIQVANRFSQLILDFQLYL